MSEIAMWIFVVLFTLALMAVAVVFFISRVRKFGFIQKIGKGKKSTTNIAAIITTMIACGILAIIFGAINTVIIFIHWGGIWVITTFIQWLIRKIRHSTSTKDHTGIITLILTAIYMSVSAYLCMHVWQTNYDLSTSKNIGQLRVIQFSDSHVGTTFSGAELQQYVDQMNELHPDIVVITGDYVDDATGYQDMVDACAALGNLETTYGVYYSFGNHDKGYYDNSDRGYDADMLIAELEANGVTVLQDEAVLVDDRFYVVGRQDKSEETQRDNVRATMDELLGGLDHSKYIIVLDHQPNDYDAQAAAGADLVLSGHTHGGQFLPINRIGELTGANDYTYGHTHIDNTDFIVSSGIADWELYFKTGCYSEYVVIDIAQ